MRMTKAELRTIYLERRRSLSVEDTAKSSRLIANRFFGSFDLATIRSLHCFIPIAKFNEIDTALIFRKVWSDFPATRTVAPRVNRETDELQNLVFASDTELVESPWGVGEPKSGDTVGASQIDMVLVPLLCFDERGYRVGYGKGFYDKFLSQCRTDCLKIGLSFFKPVEQIDDVHDTDVRLDVCITPDSEYRFE